MPTTPAAYAPSDYEVAHAKRVLARHKKATGSKPSAVAKPATRATVARPPAEHVPKPKAGRFDHLAGAVLPQAAATLKPEARITSPAIQRAEKAAADRRDHADLARHGRILSAAERRAADDEADEVVKLAGLR